MSHWGATNNHLSPALWVHFQMYFGSITNNCSSLHCRKIIAYVCRTTISIYVCLILVVAIPGYFVHTIRRVFRNIFTVYIKYMHVLVQVSTCFPLHSLFSKCNSYLYFYALGTVWNICRSSIYTFDISHWFKFPLEKAWTKNANHIPL